MQFRDSSDRRAVKDTGEVHIHDMPLHLPQSEDDLRKIGFFENVLDLIEQGALRLFGLPDVFVVNRFLDVEKNAVGTVVSLLRVR